MVHAAAGCRQDGGHVGVPRGCASRCRAAVLPAGQPEDPALSLFQRHHPRDPSEMDECHAYLDRAIKERGLKREIFLGRKGDVFILSCQIAHGGSPIADPKRTRKSLVTHYWRANDMARHKLEGVNRRLFFRQGPQPVPSDPLWKRLAGRALLERAGRGGCEARRCTPAH